MGTPPPTFAYAAAALYAASLACYVRKLFAEGKWAGRAASLLLIAALVTHYFALLQRAFSIHSVPYQDIYGSTSLLAWFLALTYLSLEFFHRERAMGAFALPLVLLLLGLDLIVTPHTAPRAPARGSIFALHVTTNILAYSAFTISFVFSVIYLVQDRLIRKRRPGAMLWRLPPMEDLERMTRNGVRVGLIAMIFGIGMGMVVDQRLTGQFLSLDPKVLISFLMLACYSAYLWVARSPAWRGARASLLCAASYFVVVFSYTVVNLYLSGFHRFY
ncbi:MAG TPA: cytochrome c biogenesis protein CcsA [Candidatus Binatia bacterium]|nr:cytochrome c biogenesis protein CcsA [Candidatus Binatia bacterium]